MLPAFRITTALCYAVADYGTAPLSRFDALNDAKALQATACRIDRWAHANRPTDWYAAQRLIMNAAELAEAILKPKQRTQSRAERREATRMADKLRARTLKPSRATQRAIREGRARMNDIIAGKLAATPSTQAFENTMVPTRSSALLWEDARLWEDTTAGLAAAWASR